MNHLDTHVVVWLFSNKRGRIPRSVQRRIEEQPVAVSPTVELELAFLFDVGKMRSRPRDVLDDLGASLELAISDAPFTAVARAAADLTWTRDPFDRLIVAQAVVDRASLVTADETMLANLPTAVWS